MNRPFAMLLATAVLAAAALTGCQTTPTQQGAVVGGLLGSGAGAIIGHQSGKPGEGALIGAGVGALTGALVGDAVDESRGNVRPSVAAPSPAPAQAYRQAPVPVQRGHYETRLVRSASDEVYEERVWVPEG